MEAEYIVALEVVKDVIWLRNFLMDLRVVLAIQWSISLYYDYSETIANSREPRAYKKGKHIEHKYYQIQEIVQKVMLK